jgi:hypothetical protein
MRRPIVLLLLLYASIAQARLGESAHQTALRYGNALSKRVYHGYHIAIYSFEDLEICQIYSADDRCIDITYGKIFSWHDLQVLVRHNLGTYIIDAWDLYHDPDGGLVYSSPEGSFVEELKGHTGISTAEGAEALHEMFGSHWQSGIDQL